MNWLEVNQSDIPHVRAKYLLQIKPRPPALIGPTGTNNLEVWKTSGIAVGFFTFQPLKLTQKKHLNQYGYQWGVGIENSMQVKHDLNWFRHQEKCVTVEYSRDSLYPPEIHKMIKHILLFFITNKKRHIRFTLILKDLQSRSGTDEGVSIITQSSHSILITGKHLISWLQHTAAVDRFGNWSNSFIQMAWRQVRIIWVIKIIIAMLTVMLKCLDVKVCWPCCSV